MSCRSISFVLAVFLASGCAKPLLPPVAELIAETVVTVGAYVRLDGSTSVDTNKPPRVLTFTWSFNSLPPGSVATFNDPHLWSPTFKADVAGEYGVKLVVDNGSLSAVKDMVITAGPCGSQTPIIGALKVDPATPILGQAMRLTGEATDPDNEAACALPAPQTLRFSWALTGAPPESLATLAHQELAAPGFTPDVPGEYVFRLTVDDGKGRSASKELKVVVAACGNNAPSIKDLKSVPANALVGTPVSLSATVLDPDNDVACAMEQTVSLRWALRSTPGGSRAALSSTAADTTWFIPDLVGEYLVEAAAVDSTGRKSPPKPFKLTAGTCTPAIGPLTSVPSAPKAFERVTVSADTSGSSCPASDRSSRVASVEWSFTKTPIGSVAAILDPKAKSAVFVPDLPGDYGVNLAIVDLGGRTNQKAATISVIGQACGTHVPAVKAPTFSPATPGVGHTVTFDTPSIINPDGDPALCGLRVSYQYRWTALDLPPGSRAALNGDALLRPSFVPDAPGTYRFQVVVTARNGKSSLPAEVEVLVSTCGTAVPSIDDLKASPTKPLLGQETLLSATVTSADRVAGCHPNLTLTRRWRIVGRPSGSLAVLNDPTGESPSFVPDRIGDFLIRLEALDGAGHRSVKDLTVSTNPCGGSSPVVTSFSAQPSLPKLRDAVTLSAVVTDADNSTAPGCVLGQTFTYSWSFVSQPPASQALLSSPVAASPTFVPDVLGTYQVRLQVTDSIGLRSAPAVYTVTTSSCGTNAPSAKAEGTLSAFSASQLLPGTAVPQVSTESSSVALFSGLPVKLSVNIVDLDNVSAGLGGCSLSQTITANWQIVGLPYGSTRATLNSATALSPTFVADVPGDYQFAVTSRDDTGRSTTQIFKLTTLLCGVHAPFAAAAITSPIPVPASASVSLSVLSNTVIGLDGSKSYDKDTSSCLPSIPQTLSHRWVFTQVPAGANPVLVGANSLTPSFLATGNGVYEVSLFVDDGILTSKPATVTVTSSSAISVIDRGAGPFTALALDPSSSDDPLIAYLDVNSGTVRVAKCVSKCTSGTPTFAYLPEVASGLSQLAAPALNEPRPVDVVVNPAGQVFVAYFDTGSCGLAVAAFDTSKQSWNTRVLDTPSSGCAGGAVGREVSLTLASGQPAIVYSVQDASTAAVHLRAAVCNSACATETPSWSSPIDVMAPIAGCTQGRWPSVQFTSGSDGRLAYYVDGGAGCPVTVSPKHLRYAECTGADCFKVSWASGVVDQVTGQDLGRYASLDVSGAGQPRIAYRDETRKLLKYASCSGSCAAGAGKWTRLVVDNGGDVGTFAVLAIDPQTGNPRIAYRSNTEKSLRLASASVGGFSFLTLDRTGDAGEFPALLLSPSGNLRISYWDRAIDTVKFFSFGP